MGDSVPAVVWESLSVLAERGHAGVTLGEDPRGEPPLFVRAGPCAFVLASLLEVHEVSAPACVTPWGPLVRDTGWDLVSTLSPGRTGSPGRRMHRRR